MTSIYDVINLYGFTFTNEREIYDPSRVIEPKMWQSYEHPDLAISIDVTSINEYFIYTEWGITSINDLLEYWLDDTYKV